MAVTISTQRATMPGVAVKRFTADDHLFRAYPPQFSSVLHLEGSSEWTMRRTQWSTRPGSLGAKVPGELYTERSRDGRAAFQVVVFDDALVADARAALDQLRTAPTYIALAADDPRGRALRRLHARVLASDATPDEHEQVLCEALAAFVELVCAPAPRHRESAAVARARSLLDARLTESIGLDELAAHARLDKYRLCRAFRDEHGAPPHAYVTLRRIGLAQHLLIRGVGQAEVAARVGLYDQSQLHRHFKRIVGVTPGAYARAMR